MYIKENREQVTKRLKDAGYMNILAGYVISVFQNFENFLRTENDLVEDDIRLVLNEYNSSFITYELNAGIYTFNDLSEALFNILQPENEAYSNVFVIEFDDITIKTELVVRNCIIAIRFDEKSFFNTMLGFTPRWDYKQYNEYISQKIVNSNRTNKIRLKIDVTDGSVVNALKQQILYSFVLDKLPGYEVLSETETIHHKKINKSLLNTITFYLEDDNNVEVDFKRETLTFTLQMIKI